MAVSETLNEQEESEIATRGPYGFEPDKPSASGRHFSGRLKVDISSMRQLVTEAHENAFSAIDIQKALCKCQRWQTYQRSK
jgi:hypothetical protein